MTLSTEIYLVNQTVKNIVALRKKNKFSQAELAEEYGIEQSAYSRLEKGERKLEVDLFEFLANKFQLSMDEIVNYHQKEEIVEIAEPQQNYLTGKSHFNAPQRAFTYEQLLEKYTLQLERNDNKEKDFTKLREYTHESINALREQIDVLKLQLKKQKEIIKAQQTG